MKTIEVLGGRSLETIDIRPWAANADQLDLVERVECLSHGVAKGIDWRVGSIDNPASAKRWAQRTGAY